MVYYVLAQGHTVSKWLTMRELIRAEERLMFSRHSETRPSRPKSPDESASRQDEPEPCPLRFRRTALRKELY